MAKIYWNNLEQELVNAIKNPVVQGVVKKINDKTPDENGLVTITAADLGAITQAELNAALVDVLKKADIVDDLTTGGAQKVLSAEQGKVLKNMITNSGTFTPEDKAKLDGIEDGATKTEIIDILTSTDTAKALSANQGRVLKDLIDNKDGMTPTDKAKLDGIEEGANKYILPTATDAVLGGVKPDGTTIKITADGVISTEVQDLSAYIKTVNTTISPDVNGNIVLTAGNLDAYTKSEVDAKITQLPMVGEFTTTVSNDTVKHYVPNITLTSTDFLQVVYNGLTLKDTEWELDEITQGSGYVITLSVDQADNDLYNNVHGFIYRGFKPLQ